MTGLTLFIKNNGFVSHRFYKTFYIFVYCVLLMYYLWGSLKVVGKYFFTTYEVFWKYFCTNCDVL